jgi:hypothetical protein
MGKMNEAADADFEATKTSTADSEAQVVDAEPRPKRGRKPKPQASAVAVGSEGSLDRSPEHTAHGAGVQAVKAAIRKKNKQNSVADQQRTAASPVAADPEKAKEQAVQDERARAALAALRQKREDAYIAELRAQGKQVYTPEEVSKLTGQPIKESWSQRDMQSLVELSKAISPLVVLRKKASEINTQFIVSGRKAILALMAEVYENYLAIENRPKAQKTEVYAAIRSQVWRESGKKPHLDTPEPSLLTKCVFPKFEPKQVHMYSRSLEFAHTNKIEAKSYAKFISDTGGFEKARLAALKASPKYVERVAEQAASRNVIEELLDFERQYPFLTVSHLSSEQRSRLAVSDYRQVVVLAQVERDRIKFYASVPLTPEMDRHIRRAFFDASGGDTKKIAGLLARRRALAEEQRATYGDDWVWVNERKTDEQFNSKSRKAKSVAPRVDEIVAIESGTAAGQIGE